MYIVVEKEGNERYYPWWKGNGGRDMTSTGIYMVYISPKMWR